MSLVVGITGGIACGKSSMINYLKQKGFSVFDSDAEVCKIKRTFDFIEKTKLFFPEVIIEEKINNKKLIEIFLKDRKKLERFEKLIHPIVFEKMINFIEDNKDKKIIFLDVPLLYECKYNKYCDKVIVVYVDNEEQSKRILERKGMTEEIKEFFLSRQMKQEEKKMRADYIIYTGGDFEETHKKIDTVITELEEGLE